MHTETLKRPPRTIREVFDRLPEGTLAQLIENNIVMSPSPLYRHQKILAGINFQLTLFVKKNGLGEVLTAPMDVFFDEKNIFQPDILFISKERQSIIEENGLHGAPDLIIEILSPSTAQYDLEEKKTVYERYGIKEYWIVDPATKDVQGFILKKNVFEKFGNDKSIIHSKLLNMKFYF